jgi:hypothetical protein
MALSIKRLFATASINDPQHKWHPAQQHSAVMLSNVILSVDFIYYCAECQYAMCRYVECHHGKCRGNLLAFYGTERLRL